MTLATSVTVNHRICLSQPDSSLHCEQVGKRVVKPPLSPHSSYHSSPPDYWTVNISMAESCISQTAEYCRVYDTTRIANLLNYGYLRLSTHLLSFNQIIILWCTDSDLFDGPVHKDMHDMSSWRGSRANSAHWVRVQKIFLYRPDDGFGACGLRMWSLTVQSFEEWRVSRVQRLTISQVRQLV